MGVIQVPGRLSGKTYSVKIKGDTPSTSEQARISAYLDEQENSYAQNFSQRFGFEAPTPDDGTALGRGFEVGKAGAYSRLGTAAEYLGSGLGLESLVNTGKEMRKSGDYEAFLESLRQPKPTQLKDVTGIGSALTYLGEGIGQSIPEMAAPLAATAAGTLIGGPVAGVGAGAATAFPSFFGGNIQRQEAEVSAGRKDKVDVSDAIIGAVGQSALNAIGDKLLLGGFLKPGQKWLTRAAVGAGEGAASEVPTEITQQILERFQAGLPLDNDEAINEYVNAGILGGVMGGGIRATTAGLGLGMEKAPTPPPAVTPPSPKVGKVAGVVGVTKQGPRSGPADSTVVMLDDGTRVTLAGDATEADIAAAVDQHNQDKSKKAAESATVQLEAEKGVDYEVLPDEAYANDPRLGTGAYTDADLAEARYVYDERLAAVELDKDINPDEARRIAAQATINYIDSLQEETKQRLARFRATMDKVANPTRGVMQPSLPDEAYAKEFEGQNQQDLFEAPKVEEAPTVDEALAKVEEAKVEEAKVEEAKVEEAQVTDLDAEKFAKAAAEADARAEAAAAAAAATETRTAPKIEEAEKPAQILTDELVTELGIGTAKSALLRKLVGKPLTDTKVIQALDKWAQNDRATSENKALAARLITGQPDKRPWALEGDELAAAEAEYNRQLDAYIAAAPVSKKYTGPKPVIPVLYRGLSRSDLSEEQKVSPRPGYNNHEGGVAVFATQNPDKAASYSGANGEVVPIQVDATELIEFPAEPRIIGGREYPTFDMFEFDRRAARLGPGQVLVARNVQDLGPNLAPAVVADAQRYKNATSLSDVYAIGRGTPIKKVTPEVADVPEIATPKSGEVGTGIPSGGQGMEGGDGAADVATSAAGTEAPAGEGLGGSVSDTVGAAATAGKQPTPLSQLEEQLAAARAKAAELRKKVPARVLEREFVGGAVDPALPKAVARLQATLERQQQTANSAKAKFERATVAGATRDGRLKAYEAALAKVNDTQKQLAAAQATLSTAELRASSSRAAEPKAPMAGKAKNAYTAYVNALRNADVLRQQVDAARARQAAAAEAALVSTDPGTTVIPDTTFLTYRRGFTTKPIPPATAVEAVAKDMRKETVFRRLIQYFKQRATPELLLYTTATGGINSPSTWKFYPDWLAIDDQAKVAALLGRLNRVEREKYKFTLAEVEPLSSDAEAAHTYFSKTIRPVDAIAMMLDDLTAGYEIYEGSLRPGLTEIEHRDLMMGTGSEVAKRALNWVRANLSPEANTGIIDLVLKKQADENARQETLLDDIDQVEQGRAARKAARKKRAEEAAEVGYGPSQVASDMAAADPLVALDKELHYSVVAALNAGNLAGALRALAATTNNADVKALASRFAELAGTTRVKVLYPGDPAKNIGRARGRYWQTRADGDPEQQNIIYLNGQTGMSAHVLMHEMAHAVTARFIEDYVNHPLVKQLESLLRSLRQQAPKDILYVNGFYGLLDVKEMVAEAYGRVTFGEADNGLRDLMKATTFATETPTTKELPLNNWERFKEIVGNIYNFLLGRPSKPYPRRTVGSTIYGKETALDRFHRLVDGMLSEAPQVLPDAALQQAVGNSLTAVTTLNNAIKSAPVWDAAGRSRLADLMMSSVPVGLRRALLGPLQLEWFNDLAGKYFPQIAGLKVFDDLRRGNIRRLEQAAAPVITDLAKYAEKQPALYATLMSIMGTSTRLEVDPTKPQSVYAADPEKIRVWHDLNRQLRGADQTGEMRKLFQTTRALFESYRNEMLDVLRTRVKELTNDTATQNQIYKRLVDKLDSEGVIDPYFSLMRKGDFWLVYTAEDNTAAAVSFDPFGRPQRPTTQYVQAFTSAWARNAFRAKLEAAKDANGKRVAWDITENRRPKADRHLKGYVPPDFIKGALNIIDTTVPKTTQDTGAEQRAKAAREAIEDLFLAFLPEQSIMKSFSKRKGTRGFIGDITPIGVVDRPQDMVSMLENKSHSIAFQLSNMKYGSEIQRLMNQADETFKKLKDGDLTSGESVAVDAYHEEFMARATYAKSPTVSAASQTLRGLTFGFTLGGSIAGAANNLMQIAMVGVPELASRYGGLRAAQRELGSATRILMNAGKTQKVMSYGPNGRTARELTSIDNYGSVANYFTPIIRKNAQTGAEELAYVLRTDITIPPKLRNKIENMDVLVEVLSNNDMLGGSTNQELLEATSDWWRKINRWSGFLMHHTERFNRQTMAVAAYNLELGKLAAGGATPDYATKLAAAQKAVEITERVNGSIGAAQGSRWSQGAIGSLVMMYKRFGMMMTRYLINTTKQALKRITPGMSQADIADAKQERAVARYQIIGVLGAAALFSGVQGLPFFGELMTLLDVFFTDDDDEPPKVVVQKFLGEPYYNGALNYLLGIEIASRISLSGLVFRESKIDKDQSALYDLFEMFGGPAVGVAMNLERGAELLSQGETYRGVEAIMPSAIKSGMKAARFGTEGASTLRGDEIVQLSSMDLVKQLIGYTPEAYARQQERTSLTKRMDEAVREKKRSLLRKYNIAVQEGDFAEVREVLRDMQEFSRKYPEDAIGGDTLTRSLRGFKQRSGDMIGGVSFNRPDRAQRQIDEFDDDTTLWADLS